MGWGKEEGEGELRAEGKGMREDAMMESNTLYANLIINKTFSTNLST